jgi:hypothetical protein
MAMLMSASIDASEKTGPVLPIQVLFEDSSPKPPRLGEPDILIKSSVLR